VPLALSRSLARALTRTRQVQGTPEELQQRLDRAHAALQEQQRLAGQLRKIVDLKHALLDEAVRQGSYTKAMMIRVCAVKKMLKRPTPVSLPPPPFGKKSASSLSRTMMQVLAHTEAETRWNINSKLCHMAAALGHLSPADASLPVEWLFPSLSDRMLKVPVNDAIKVRNAQEASAC